ncbi:polysaccharide pyruvyl transferase family protein [Jonesia quinghaiensis]|uniref:polysaccharide pyruvyl transferase family protein n=1 Tax=Jonesia quinghaiensis TaxID=262806 RepID=UPI0004035E94|nr:polysaccharide pyruvyl transferase family protein [Jonesia quinghaiensis]
MPKILVRAAQNPLLTYGTMESTRLMGGNSGNLLYANGVARALSAQENTVRYGGFAVHRDQDPSQWIAETNAKYDHYVMPMSNMFRASFTTQLQSLTRIIRQLEIPVTIVGAGAQTTADAAESEKFTMGRTGRTKTMSTKAADRHNEAIYNLVEAVLEKSHSMGVRGEYTRKFLVSLGLPADRITVIGCPSIFTWGPQHQVNKGVDALTPRSAVSMNIDYRVPGIERLIDANMARYRNLTSPSQDAKSARMIVTGNDQYDLDTVNLGTPVHTGHPLYKKRKVVYYPNPWGWIESFTEQDFAFGTRLHGNIAAILAGTPAHILAHDSRTLELAEYHAMPHTKYTRDGDVPLAEDLYQDTDYTQFNELMPQRFETYLQFLRDNNLHTIWDEDGTAPRFDKKIRAGKRIGAVRPPQNNPALRFANKVQRKAESLLRR